MDEEVAHSKQHTYLLYVKINSNTGSVNVMEYLNKVIAYKYCYNK